MLKLLAENLFPDRYITEEILSLVAHRREILLELSKIAVDLHRYAFQVDHKSVKRTCTSQLHKTCRINLKDSNKICVLTLAADCYNSGAILLQF